MTPEKIAELKQSVEQAAGRSGRRGEEIQIVLVTKTVPPAKIQEAVACGMKTLGENRVQELLEKKEALKDNTLSWHLIGHLQTNKVRQVLGHVDLIHSLDSLELADEIQRQAQKKQIAKVRCLIQVNTSGEASKFGIAPEAVENFVKQMIQPAVEICGLMTLGPLTENESQIRGCFRNLKQIQEQLKKKFPEKKWDILSMGMSGDYKIAIEEGATMIRIGTAVFGERTK